MPKRNVYRITFQIAKPKDVEHKEMVRLLMNNGNGLRILRELLEYEDHYGNFQSFVFHPKKLQYTCILKNIAPHHPKHKACMDMIEMLNGQGAADTWMEGNLCLAEDSDNNITVECIPSVVEIAALDKTFYYYDAPK